MTWNDVLTVVNAGDTLLGVAILGWLGWKVWRKVRRASAPTLFTFHLGESDAQRAADVERFMHEVHDQLKPDVIDSPHGDSDSG